ncbi:hypothetical protein GCM10027047_13100 [Rhodococcus aerolatus]
MVAWLSSLPAGADRDRLVRRVTGWGTLAVGMTGLLLAAADGGPPPGAPRTVVVVISLSTVVVAGLWFRARRTSRRWAGVFGVYAEAGIGVGVLLVHERYLGLHIGIGLAVVATYGVFLLNPRRLVLQVVVSCAVLLLLAALALQQHPDDPAGVAARLVVGLVLAAVFPLYVRLYIELVRTDAAAHQELAHHDALTGCLNRRGLDLELRALTGETQPGAVLAPLRPGDGLTLVVLDLDAFKAVNDTHGHARGDEVLRLVGERLRASVDGCGVVARTGGEEFAALVPGGTSRDRLGDDLLAAVHRPDDALPVTASIGVVHARGPCTHRQLRRLVDAADDAMYRAKRGGGHAVVHAAG